MIREEGRPALRPPTDPDFVPSSARGWGERNQEEGNDEFTNCFWDDELFLVVHVSACRSTRVCPAAEPQEAKSKNVP